MKPENRCAVLAMVLPSVILICTLTACQSRFLTYEGAMAKEESRVPLLDGGPHIGSWKTLDLQMEYRYVRTPDSLQIAGDLEFDSSLQFGFTTMERFYLRVNFLDTEGKVLESRAVVTSSYRKMIKKLTFERDLELPAGTRGMAFSYKGRVRDVGGGTDSETGGQTEWYFWRAPFH